jgi:hypothetical protein
MSDRLPTFPARSLLVRVAVLVLVALAATAGLTYAAGSQLTEAPAVPDAVTAPTPPLVVPDVRNQAFVFAKGTLEEAGFAWLVSGSVRGYPANIVASQSPAAGTRVVDAGAPRITVVLKRGTYPQTGEPQDASPYSATVPQPADLAGRAIGPAAPAPSVKRKALHATPKAVRSAKAVTPATATPGATATPERSAVPAAADAAWPKQRPAAFDVPGARTEPLDEMPLPARANALLTWVEAHPTKTHANIDHWMFQHEWIVTGATMGWWHGASALQTLVSVDRRVQQLWGIGRKSRSLAQHALDEVRARARS